MQVQRARATVFAFIVVVVSGVVALVQWLGRPEGIGLLVALAAGVGLPLVTAGGYVAKCRSKHTRTGRLCGNWRSGIAERCSIKAHREFFTLHDALALMLAAAAVGNAILWYNFAQ